MAKGRKTGTILKYCPKCERNRAVYPDVEICPDDGAKLKPQKKKEQ